MQFCNTVTRFVFGKMLPVGVFVLVIFSSFRTSADVNKLEEAISAVVAMNEKAAISQQRIDETQDVTDKLLTQYMETESQIEKLRAYNTQIEKLVDSQNARMNDLHEQINGAAMIGREITPLMFRMLESLEKFMELDVPFLMEERHARLRDLREMFDSTVIADSEKFRRLLEAYQIENEYGRTIEAYQEKTKIGDKTITVDFLRIGRVTLYYRTLDKKSAGIWDRRTRSFVPLPQKHHSALNNGFRMARKQIAPDLISLPIPTPEDAK